MTDQPSTPLREAIADEMVEDASLSEWRALRILKLERDCERLTGERDHARAEWHRNNERADDLRAEVKHWRHVAATAKDQRDTAEAEVRRLRGALQAVRDHCRPSYRRTAGGVIEPEYERGYVHGLDEVYRLLDAALGEAE